MKDAERDATHRVSRNDLILENIFRFSIELVRELADPSYFIFESRCGGVAEKTSNRFRHERCPVRRNMVDLFSEIIGNGDGYAHTIKVSQERTETQRARVLP